MLNLWLLMRRPCLGTLPRSMQQILLPGTRHQFAVAQDTPSDDCRLAMSRVRGMSVKFKPSPIASANPTETHSSGAYAGTDVLEIMAEAKNYNAYLAALIDRRLRPGMRVLDFGAGVGTFAEPLARRGVNVICVETDAAQRQRL